MMTVPVKQIQSATLGYTGHGFEYYHREVDSKLPMRVAGKTIAEATERLTTELDRLYGKGEYQILQVTELPSKG